MDENKCDKCDGSRLKNEVNFFKIDKKNIIEISDMDLKVLHNWFSKLRGKLSRKELEISKEIIE